MAIQTPSRLDDRYGGLREPGEALEAALHRLERRRDFTAVLGTSEAQRLLEDVARVALGARQPEPDAG